MLDSSSNYTFLAEASELTMSFTTVITLRLSLYTSRHLSSILIWTKVLTNEDRKYKWIASPLSLDCGGTSLKHADIHCSPLSYEKSPLKVSLLIGSPSSWEATSMTEVLSCKFSGFTGTRTTGLVKFPVEFLGIMKALSMPALPSLNLKWKIALF